MVALLEFATFILLTSFLVRFKVNKRSTSFQKSRKKDIYDAINLIEKSDGYLHSHCVKANTSLANSDHPVVHAVLKRWATKSLPGKRKPLDSNKIALCVEGGGMRGCVAAGSAAAINFLGLNDAVDIVYGSSAGAMVATYFISRQFGAANIYHEILPAAGTNFVDKKQLFRAMGIRPKAIFSEVMAKLSRVRSRRQLTKRFASIGHSNIHDSLDGIQSDLNDSTDVFNLDFLLEQVMGELQPLDWETFSKNEKHQELRIVASLLTNMSSILFSRREGHYSNLPSLLRCIRASMLVPGITGDLMAVSSSCPTPDFLRTSKLLHPVDVLSGGASLLPIQNESFVDDDSHSSWVSRLVPSWLREGGEGEGIGARRGNESEEVLLPVADAFLCEPMPYRSAVQEGATHVIMLRTRPDPSPVLGKGPGLYERMIAPLFFKRYSMRLPVEWLQKLRHHVAYAEDLLTLNEAAVGPKEGVEVGVGRLKAHILPVACGEAVREVSQLEMKRSVVLQGMRDGARRVLELFLPAMLAWEGEEVEPTGNLPEIGQGLEFEKLLDSLVDSIFPLSVLANPIERTTTATLVRGSSNQF